MIINIKDSKGIPAIFIAERKNIVTNIDSYFITNKDMEGVEISGDDFIKYLQDIIDKEI